MPGARTRNCPRCNLTLTQPWPCSLTEVQNLHACQSARENQLEKMDGAVVLSERGRAIPGCCLAPPLLPPPLFQLRGTYRVRILQLGSKRSCSLLHFTMVLTARSLDTLSSKIKHPKPFRYKRHGLAVNVLFYFFLPLFSQSDFCNLFNAAYLFFHLNDNLQPKQTTFECLLEPYFRLKKWL